MIFNNKIVRSCSALIVFSALIAVLFFACKKNDINVIESELGGTTTTGASSSTSTTGTTTGCNPSLNMVSFSNSPLNGFSGLSGLNSTFNGEFTIYSSVTVGGYLHTVRVILPMTTAPTSSATYSIDYNYFTNGYNLSAGKCALRFYKNSSGATYYGYGSAGTIDITVSGSYITATFCNVTFKNYNGTVFLYNGTATGKTDN